MKSDDCETLSWAGSAGEAQGCADLSTTVVTKLRQAKQGVGSHTVSQALSSCWELLSYSALDRAQVGAKLTEAVDHIQKDTD